VQVLDELLPCDTYMYGDRGSVGRLGDNLYSLNGRAYRYRSDYEEPEDVQDLELLHGNRHGKVYSRSCAAAASGSWPSSRACFLRLLEEGPLYWDAPAVAAVAAAHGQLEFLQWSRSIDHTYHLHVIIIMHSRTLGLTDIYTRR
jgi:hypothetical protein